MIIPDECGPESTINQKLAEIRRLLHELENDDAGEVGAEMVRQFAELHFQGYMIGPMMARAEAAEGAHRSVFEAHAMDKALLDDARRAIDRLSHDMRHIELGGAARVVPPSYEPDAEYTFRPLGAEPMRRTLEHDHYGRPPFVYEAHRPIGRSEWMARREWPAAGYPHDLHVLPIADARVAFIRVVVLREGNTPYYEYHEVEQG